MPTDRDEPAPLTRMRALGQFVGHIVRGVRWPGPQRARRVRREVESRAVQTPAGQVTLRRTTIDEVVLPPKER